MRSFGPVPLTRDRSTPSSRAKARTEGDACAFLKPSLSTGGAGAGSAALPDADGAGAADDVEGAEGWAGGAALRGASALACCGAAAPAVSSVRITLPSLTLSPTLTLRSFILPAEGEGTSMVALSDSSVTSASSGLT